MTEYLLNCDWGTTHFRLRAVKRGDGQIVAQTASDQGVARLSEAPDRPERFAAVLRAGIDQLASAVGEALRGAPCYISGMASSSIGWRELDYARVPLALDGRGLMCQPLEVVACSSGPHPVTLVSGLRTAGDVMRGEETQVVGLFQLPALGQYEAGAMVVMPGTHSKHVRVEGGQIVDFQTFMTGEMFDVLGHHSILRHSIADDPAVPESRDEIDAFRAGVCEGQDAPLAAALFRVRTRAVLDGQTPRGNRAFLSGVLIGSELAYLVRGGPSDHPVLLAAPTALAAWYAEACDGLGLTARLVVVDCLDVERLSALGQAVLARYQAA